jgi:hypothetical protein
VTGPSETLLRLGRTLLGVSVLDGPVAVRGALLLARRALEHDVASRLSVGLAGAEAGTMRAQLLCLRSLDRRTGEEAALLFSELSRACHHHPYELGPSVDEARTLLERTARLLRRPHPAVTP